MFFDHTSLNIAFPILTLLFFDLQSHLFSPDTSQSVRSMWYGLCVALPHIINMITTPILSALSDEFGRKKILLLGTLGALLFSLTAAFGILLGSLSLLFLSRFIQGAFSRTNPIAQAAIGDMSDKNKKVRYMGYLQTSISIGAFIGPILGGYFANQFFFQQLNFSLPYFIAALFAGISFILTLLYFNETLELKNKTHQWSEVNWTSLKKVFLNREVIRISIILLLCQMSWSLYYQFIPPILKINLQFNAHQLGLFVGMIALWLSLATTFGIHFLERFFKFEQILKISIFLILIGLFLTFIFCYWQIKNQFFIWFAAIPTAIGDVISYSCLIALYSNVVDKKEQGKVMGLCFIVVACMWALTGVVGGFLMSVYELLPLLVAPIGILLAIRFLYSKKLGVTNG